MKIETKDKSLSSYFFKKLKVLQERTRETQEKTREDKRTTRMRMV